MMVITDKDEKVVYTIQLFESCFYKSNNNTMCQRDSGVCVQESVACERSSDFLLLRVGLYVNRFCPGPWFNLVEWVYFLIK
jgi:hypothetical protein